MIAVQDRWKPLVEREPSHAPECADERDRPLDFVLTPRERDQVALAKLYLERRRRELNRRDTARDMESALASQQQGGAR